MNSLELFQALEMPMSHSTREIQSSGMPCAFPKMRGWIQMRMLPVLALTDLIQEPFRSGCLWRIMVLMSPAHIVMNFDGTRECMELAEGIHKMVNAMPCGRFGLFGTLKITAGFVPFTTITMQIHLSEPG